MQDGCGLPDTGLVSYHKVNKMCEWTTARDNRDCIDWNEVRIGQAGLWIYSCAPFSLRLFTRFSLFSFFITSLTYRVSHHQQSISDTKHPSPYTSFTSSPNHLTFRSHYHQQLQSPTSKMSAHRPAPLMSFLPLSPVTSESFPKAQQPRPAGVEVHKRRTSSMSSSGTSTMKVLKVAPVHFGEHAGDHQGDWVAA